ncbi:MAG TPA: serine hydrolase [Ohtaekwangia sp.]|nr:serine hydrolase [Ohtaekwangia sp.]
MKTSYKFLLIILLLGLFTAACDESDSPIDEDSDEQVEDNNNSDDAGSMYFPEAGSDDWKQVSAVDLAWDTTYLNEAIRYAKENRSYNLLILHKGRMVVEEYWSGTDAKSRHDLGSVAKSMTAFIIGILQEDGTLRIDDKVNNYLAEGWSRSPETEGEITIRHLLTMTSGLNDDLDYVGRPGETWRYSHGAYVKLYEVIEAATGKSYREVFDSILFTPTGMTGMSWSGTDLLSPGRAIARFGLMMLNDGTWDGKKLLQDEGYFSDMLSTSQTIQKSYGYLWWLNGKESWYDDDKRVTIDGPIASSMPDDAWLAKGKHDQRIYVVPSLDLVVIRQGGYIPLPESGEGSFDVEFWKRLMRAINGPEA